MEQRRTFITKTDATKGRRWRRILDFLEDQIGQQLDDRILSPFGEIGPLVHFAGHSTWGPVETADDEIDRASSRQLFQRWNERVLCATTATSICARSSAPALNEHPSGTVGYAPNLSAVTSTDAELGPSREHMSRGPTSRERRTCRSELRRARCVAVSAAPRTP